MFGNPEHLAVVLDRPLVLQYQAYQFRLLSDGLLSKEEQAQLEHRPWVQPELTLRLGVCHRVSGRCSHLATATENHAGASPRVRALYRRATQLPAAEAGPSVEQIVGIPSGTDWLAFSGRVLLPAQLPEQNIDVYLVGSKESDTSSKRTRFRCTELRVGPILDPEAWNPNTGMQGNGTIEGLLDLLDLKLGIFSEDQATSLGTPSF